MPVVPCQFCSKKFYTKPFWLKRGFGKYCSSACQYQGARKGKEKACDLCGTISYKTLKQLTHSKSGKFFCTKSCQTKWRNQLFIGSKHANWKHGRSAYQSVLKRAGLPVICTLCKTKDPRVLAVHHKDRNRLNNNIDNLAWLCHNCHFLVHHYDEGREKDLLRPRVLSK